MPGALGTQAAADTCNVVVATVQVVAIKLLNTVGAVLAGHAPGAGGVGPRLLQVTDEVVSETVPLGVQLSTGVFGVPTTRAQVCVIQFGAVAVEFVQLATACNEVEGAGQVILLKPLLRLGVGAPTQVF